MASQQEILQGLQQQGDWIIVGPLIDVIMSKYLRNEITKKQAIEDIQKLGEPYAGYSGLLFSWIFNKKDRK